MIPNSRDQSGASSTQDAPTGGAASAAAEVGANPLVAAPTSYPGEVEYVLAGRQWVEVLDQATDAWFPQVLGAVRRLA